MILVSMEVPPIDSAKLNELSARFGHVCSLRGPCILGDEAGRRNQYLARTLRVGKIYRFTKTLRPTADPSRAGEYVLQSLKSSLDPDHLPFL